MILNLSAREAGALARLLDAYLATEECDPTQLELTTIALKLDRLPYVDPLAPASERER